MAINKISFEGVNSKRKTTQVKRHKQEYIDINEDKEKSNAAKYMIGATALAAAVAVGIIGHNRGWWKTAAQNVKDGLSRKTNTTIDNIEDEAQQLTENLSEKSTKVSKPRKNKTAKTPKTTTAKDNVASSDLTTVEGKVYESNRLKLKDLKDAKGRVVKTLASKDGNTLEYIADIDPDTGNLLKKTYFQQDGKTVDFITDYDPSTSNPVKMVHFRTDGKTADFKIDYDPATGNLLRKTFLMDDGKTVESSLECDPLTDRLLKKIYYNPDGSIKRIEDLANDSIFTAQTAVTESSKATETVVDSSIFSDFAKVKGEVYELDGFKCKDLKDAKGRVVKTLASKDGNTLEYIADVDPDTGNLLRKTHFQQDGKTQKFVIDYDPATGDLLKWSEYQDDGKSLHMVLEYDPSKNKPSKKTFYGSDGSVIHSVDL